MINYTPPSKDSNSTLIEVKLPSDSLEIGMLVTRLDRPWTEVPVLLQGLTIESPDDIDMLREHCVFVYIEIEKEFWLEAGKGTVEAKEEKQYPGFREEIDIHDELPRAQLTYDKTKDHVEEVLTSLSNGESFDIEASRQAIQSCVSSILNNANALLWLTQVKEQHKYTAEHSLRVGILAIAFGRFIGLKEHELETIGLCGMLHDIGKTKIPDDILNKPGRLTRIEYDIMKQHSVYGKELLDEQQGVNKLIKDTAHFHHERIDGKGYPEKLSAAYLHQFVRMVSIVDVYDAITSTRSYKDGSPAFDALKILYAERDKHFDSELVEAFIRMVGIYPPGTLVEMTNGEVGIVVSANADSRLRPKVELVMTADKKFRSSYVINLIKDPIDKHGKPYAIKEGITNGTHGVDVKDYILQ
jgi:putative nucleotidyltransferase with HDIG domain